MIGNQIDQFTRQGSQKTVGAVLTMLLALVLLVLMLYYLRTTRRADREARRADDAPGCAIHGAGRASCRW